MRPELEKRLSSLLFLLLKPLFNLYLFSSNQKEKRIKKIKQINKTNKKKTNWQEIYRKMFFAKNIVTEICNAPLKSQDIGALGVDKENLCNLKLP